MRSLPTLALRLFMTRLTGERDDLAAYLDIAEELDAKRVLDVGCGTGCLAVLLAGSGRTVVGVDPADASLEVAKSKDKAAAITWVHGDATKAPAFGADLAVMTGNVAQVFLTDEDWAQTLQAIHAALRPHGYLVFETRRPERRAWEEWAADTRPVILNIPGNGPVEQRREVTGVNLPFVSFRCTSRSWLTARSSPRTPPCAFAAAMRSNRAWPPTATGCWMCETPLIAHVASSCSSPGARPEPAGQKRPISQPCADRRRQAASQMRAWERSRCGPVG